MKKYFIVALAVSSLILTASIVFAADDCDPKFKDVELYLCKMGRATYKVGMREDDAATCIEHRRLTVNGCQVEHMKGSQDDFAIYMLGDAKKDYQIHKFEFQCDSGDSDASRTGGFKKGSGFEKWMHPDYFPAKTPGKYNDERVEMFNKDIAKKGKQFLADGVLGMYNPANEFTFKYNKQTCQFYNPVTNKIAFKFTWSTDYKAEKEQPQMEQQTAEPKETPAEQPQEKENQEDKKPESLLNKIKLW